MRKKYFDVLAIQNDGSQEPLKYIGEISSSQSGLDLYWNTQDSRATFDSNSLGLQLLLIGYAKYMYDSDRDIFYEMVDLDFRNRFENSIADVKVFYSKWFEADVNPKSDIFPYYCYDNGEPWEQISKNTFYNASFKVKLLSKDFDISYGQEPIFIKKEYFYELKRDVDALLKILL